MTDNPAISIVIPARNAEATIARAVTSTLEDSPDRECVVVDDGSEDGTAAVVESLNDARVRLVRQPHAGVAQAANRGTREARASLIARMDADDVSHPGRLDRQLRHLRENRLDVVGGRVRIVDQDGRPVPSLQRYERWANARSHHEEIAAYRFVETPVINPTALVRREVFELGYRDGPIPEDYDLWLRAFAAGYRFGVLPEPVLDWIDGPGRLTRTDDRYLPAAFDRARREHLLAGPLQAHQRVNAWGAGKTGKPWLRWLRENGRTVEFVVEVSPNKVGRVIHETPVIHPDDLPRPDGTPMLVAVGAEGARELIATALRTAGYRPGRDVWFVA